MEQTEAQLKRQARDAALKTVGAYALFAALWILLSDWGVGMLVTDAAVQGYFQTFKGLLFVAVTCVALWMVMRRYFGSWQREILARKKAELAKGDSEARLQTVSNLARVGLVIVDQHHRYRYANHSYLEILQIPPQNLVGRSVADVLGEAAYLQQIKPRLDRALAGERVRYELVMPRRNGSASQYYDVSYEPGTDASGRIVVVVVVDITERKQAAEVIARELELQRRLANIAATVPGIIYQFRQRADGAASVPFASEAVGDFSASRPRNSKRTPRRSLPGCTPPTWRAFGPTSTNRRARCVPGWASSVTGIRCAARSGSWGTRCPCARTTAARSGRGSPWKTPPTRWRSWRCRKTRLNCGPSATICRAATFISTPGTRRERDATFT